MRRQRVRAVMANPTLAKSIGQDKTKDGVAKDVEASTVIKAATFIMSIGREVLHVSSQALLDKKKKTKLPKQQP
jgi:hypothetical protein